MQVAWSLHRVVLDLRSISHAELCGNVDLFDRAGDPIPDARVMRIYDSLSYDFPRFSAKVEPLHTTAFMACSGGGRIVGGVVIKDRFRVRSTTVFA